MRLVKLTAQQRIAEMVEPALTELAKLIEQADSDVIKLAAIKDVLDRAGYKPRERVESTGKMVIEVVYGDAPESAGLYQTPALGPADDQE